MRRYCCSSMEMVEFLSRYCARRGRGCSKCLARCWLVGWPLGGWDVHRDAWGNDSILIMKLYIYFSNGWVQPPPRSWCVFLVYDLFGGESFKGSLLGKSFQKPGSPRGGGVNVKKKQVTEVSDIYIYIGQRIIVMSTWPSSSIFKEWLLDFFFDGYIDGNPSLAHPLQRQRDVDGPGFRASGTDPPCRSPRFRRSGPRAWETCRTTKFWKWCPPEN